MTTFKASGKAVSGGKLVRAYRGGKVVGCIVEAVGLFMAHATPGQPAAFIVCESLDEAKAQFWGGR